MTHIDDTILAGKHHIHFIGVGGSGMFPIVQILLSQGYAISGSDNNPGETLDAKTAFGAMRRGVKQASGEPFQPFEPRSAPGVGPQARREQEFGRVVQSAERAPYQPALLRVAERPEGQHHQPVGRDAERAAACVARNVHLPL